MNKLKKITLKVGIKGANKKLIHIHTDNLKEKLIKQLSNYYYHKNQKLILKYKNNNLTPLKLTL